MTGLFLEANGLRLGCDCKTCNEIRARVAPAVPPEHDLTPSEIALAKVLAALGECPRQEEGSTPEYRLIVAIAREVFLAGFDGRGVTGRALLDRAKKAGVL